MCETFGSIKDNNAHLTVKRSTDISCVPLVLLSRTGLWIFLAHETKKGAVVNKFQLKKLENRYEVSF